MHSDRELQRRVLDELKWDPSIRETDIGVGVHGGVVTLSGCVDSYAQKVAAERAAERVGGTRVESDALKVTVPLTHERQDVNIAEEARRALAWDVEVPDERITVTVESGRITLDGSVHWQFQRAAAERAVRSLIGVTGVVNRIQIAPVISVSDVSQRIRDALRRSAEEDAGRIEVEALDGKVILRGTVRSRSERRDAVRAAWSAPGVNDVDDRVEVAR
ncbi:MAG TPA: BON domain-containing protein [Gemmatimonadaceae bacterium]